MARTSLLLSLAIIFSMDAAQLNTINTPAGVPWANTLSFELEHETSTPKITNLLFYFHDTVSGNSPSAIRVAEIRDTWKSLNLFESLMMADDPLTEGPNPNSKLVGWAQGLYGSASQHDIS
ncbi:unnamed protein product [Linum trigynum]|uniref:Dirigent protein n=1 Tax=Linum trigynum TaxID=586398 RepID=A0AAV2ERR6_9ROSI